MWLLAVGQVSSPVSGKTVLYMEDTKGKRMKKNRKNMGDIYYVMCNVYLLEV